MRLLLSSLSFFILRRVTVFGTLRKHKAVIVAKLANNPRYNELVEFYRQEFYPLRDAEQLREKYDQLVDHLKTVRPIV
jgi:hypothetical protein